ncbi:MAG: universal stress protein [Bacteroidota bacterium]
MKNILYPTDFSPEAGNARAAALTLAKLSGATLHFLHVLEPVGGYGYSFTGNNDDGSILQVYQMKLIEQANEELKKVALSSDLIEINSKYEVAVGEIYKTVLDYVTEKKIDLVVMGSKGSSGLEEVLIGSNAERIVRMSPVPVLVFKKDSANFDAKKIAFATDLKSNGTLVTDTLKKVQKLFNAEILLVNVNTPNNFYRSREIEGLLDGYAKKHGLSNYTSHSYSDTSEEDGILHFAKENKADLIIMGTHGRTGFSHLLSGSLAEDVVNHSDTPVLTAKI